MKNSKSCVLMRAMRVAALVMVLLACAVSALAAQRVVVNTASRVYQKPSLSAQSFAVPKGMELNLVAVSGSWAAVENGGVTAYINVLHLSEAGEELPDFANAVLEPRDAVVLEETYVYQYPTVFAARIAVHKGMQLKLLAVSGDWAMVENGGVRAYMKSEQVQMDGLITIAPRPTPEQTPVPDYSDLLAKAKPARITVNTRVYQSAGGSGPFANVSAGMQVNLLVINGDWAIIENAGVIAYIDVDCVELITAQSAVAAYIACDTVIYQYPRSASATIRVPAGMSVSLISVSNGWATIERGGVMAYIRPEMLSANPPASMPTPALPSTTPEAAQPDYSHLLAGSKKARLAADAPVYKHADMTSSSVSLTKGTEVRLLAVSGDWALIECDGAYGFTAAALVSVIPENTVTPVPTATPAPTVTPAATPKPTPVPDEILSSDKYSNEQKIHMYLTTRFGYSNAAASGILASMYRESRFRPDIASATGKYYGLCMWSGGRLTNLTKFCEENGYDKATLEGQLNFLHYELQKSYKKVYNYLMAVENTPEGAYDAGYYFCYYYEIPGNRQSSSEARGVLARDTYFPKYA